MHCEKSLELEPNDIENIGLYALILSEQGDNEGAKQQYEKALELEPDDAELNFLYAVFLKENLKNIKKSKEFYKKALKLNPNLPIEFKDDVEDYLIN